MRNYNDIDVYVEDGSHVGVYERLINNVLQGRARVSRVFPLGPSSNVINAAQSDVDEGGRPRLYLIDGDLDLVANLKLKRIRNLHRLCVYSVENLLLEDRAINSYIKFAMPDLQSDDAIAKTNLEELFNIIDEVGRKYVVLLDIARRLDLRDNSLRFDRTSFMSRIKGVHTKIDRVKLRKKVKNIIVFIKTKVGLGAYRKEKKIVIEALNARRLKSRAYFPGKAILWMLNERVSALGGLPLNQKVIVSYLANDCNIAFDARLQRTLRRLARGSVHREAGRGR